MRVRPTMPSSEHQLQSALCEYMRLNLRRDCDFYAVPNGGARHIRVAVRLKAEGVKRGVPDLHIMMPGARLVYLELKIKGGSLSADQKAFRDMARALGFEWGMAKTFEEAIAFLTDIGALK